MPADDTTSVEQRLEQAKARAHAAREYALEVSNTARRVVTTRKWAVVRATFNSARWKVSEQLAQVAARTIAGPGGVAYILICVVGLCYSRGYYDKFEGIDILNLFSTSDFLLSGFNNILLLVVAFLVPAAMLVWLGVTYLVSSYSRAYLAAVDGRPSRWLRGVFAAVFFVGEAALLFLLPYGMGYWDSRELLKEERFVGIAIRNDSTQTPTVLPSPERTILLGTTSDFHLFYECASGEGENADANDDEGDDGVQDVVVDVDGGEDTTRSGKRTSEGDDGDNKEGVGKTDAGCDDDDGRAFIVPTANVASVSHHRRAGADTNGQGHKYGIADIVSAIKGLNLSANVVHVVDDGSVAISAQQLVDAVNQISMAISTSDGTHNPDLTALIAALDGLDTGKLARELEQLSLAVDELRTQDGGLLEVAEAIKGIYGRVDGLGATLAALDGRVPEIGIKQLSEGVEALREVIAGLGGVSDDLCISEWRPIGIVDGFAAGEHVPNLVQAGPELNRVLSQINSRMPGQIRLIGRVDRQPLTKERREHYRSDIGLAQARAKWVWGWLAGKLAEDRSDRESYLVMPLAWLCSDGPSSGEPVNDEDRSVEVQACFGA